MDGNRVRESPRQSGEERETVKIKTVRNVCSPAHTPLKQSVNESEPRRL